MIAFASYGWIVDVDHLPKIDGQPDRRGMTGPRNIRPVLKARLEANEVAPDVKRWRCLDDDGELYYEGRWIGTDQDSGVEPLDDFAMPDAGATRIEYLNPETGEWEEL